MRDRDLARFAARCISLLWAGWWVFFAIASWTGEGAQTTQIVVPALVSAGFLVSAFLAWKWELIGGALLALEGITVILAYPLATNSRFSFATIVFVAGTLGLPPLLAGLLFIHAARTKETRHPA